MTDQNYLVGAEDELHISLISIDMAGGDLMAGILLDRLRYWFKPDKNGKPKTSINREGTRWVAKSRPMWEEECRLSERQVDLAASKLKKLGLVKTRVWKFAGKPMLHFTLDFVKCNEAYNKVIEAAQAKAQAAAKAASEVILAEGDPCQVPVNPIAPKPANPSRQKAKSISPNRENPPHDSLHEQLQLQQQDSPPPIVPPLSVPADDGGGGGELSEMGSEPPLKDLFIRAKLGPWNDTTALMVQAAIGEFGVAEVEEFMWIAMSNYKKWNYVRGIMDRRRREIQEQQERNKRWEKESDRPLTDEEQAELDARFEAIEEQRRQDEIRRREQLVALGVDPDRKVNDHVNTLWETAYGQLQLQMPREAFDTWMRGAKLISREDDTLLIGVPNIYAREWLEHRLKKIIVRTLSQIAGRTMDVRFVLWVEHMHPEPEFDPSPLTGVPAG